MATCACGPFRSPTRLRSPSAASTSSAGRWTATRSSTRCSPGTFPTRSRPASPCTSKSAASHRGRFEPTADMRFTAVEKSTITLSPDTLAPVYGTPVTFRIELRRSDGSLATGSRTLKIYHSYDGNKWAPDYFHQNTDTGVVVTQITPDRPTYYRAVYWGGDDLSQAIGEWMLVTPKVANGSPIAPKHVHAKRTFAVRGRIGAGAGSSSRRSRLRREEGWAPLGAQGQACDHGRRERCLQKVAQAHVPRHVAGAGVPLRRRLLQVPYRQGPLGPGSALHPPEGRPLGRPFLCSPVPSPPPSRYPVLTRAPCARGKGNSRGRQPNRYQDHHAARVAAALAGRPRRALRLRHLGHPGARGRPARAVARAAHQDHAGARRPSRHAARRRHAGRPGHHAQGPRRGGRAAQVARDLVRRRRARLLLARRGQDLAPHGAVHDHREPGRRRGALALEPRGRGVRLRA